MIRWVIARLLLAAPARAADLTVLTAGAVASASAAPATARALPASLSDPAARDVLVEKGMMPP